MTTVFFVRHAKPNYNNHNNSLRELTSEGIKDRKLVTKFLINKNIDVILSSPYKRSIDTVKEFADLLGIDIELIDNFRERKISDNWIKNFTSFSKKQWNDFSYKLDGGESLEEVQKRNIASLNKVLDKYKGKNIVIGTHGTSLSTIINYYDSSFGFEEFNKIRKKMPWIVEMVFDENNRITNIIYYDL